jgi:hypothetical protein
LQRVFTHHRLTLSCLYELFGSSVKLPFDRQYVGHLHGFYREKMWSMVGSGSNEMQSHIARVESRFESIKTTLGPIYKCTN